MPVEVIDLCSSPKVPAPPKATTSTVAPGPTKTNPRPPPPSRALDYDDVFDLTNIEDGDVPLPVSRASPAQERLDPKASRTSDYLFLSDDFDTTDISLNDGPESLDHRRPKKSRISGSPDRNIGRSTSTVERDVERGGGPAVRQPAGLKRWNAALDPIETTSSPLVPISSHEPNPISSDPFASSPRQVAKVSDQNKDGEDLFPSSPPGIEGKHNIPRKRAASIEIHGSSPQRARGKAPAVSVGWDHISSSAPEQNLREEDWDLDVPRPRGGLARSRSDGIDLGDLADLPVSSDDEFPDLDDIMNVTKLSSHKAGPKAGTAPRASVSKSSTSNNSKLTAEERAAVREAEKRRKLREKEEAKEQKRMEKERTAALAEVNKVRTNKNVSTPEMMVDLPTSMNPSIRLQVETLLQDLKVSSHPYSSPVNNVVKWRRKVRATFNEDAGYWEPLQQERIEPEKHAMVLMTAAEFVELALGAKGSDLEAHVLKVQRHYEGHALIYLIEGLTPWMRKNRNVRNRQFQSAARNAAVDVADTAVDTSGTATTTATSSTTPPPSSQAPQQQGQGRKRKAAAPKPPPRYIDEDAVEDALLQLQVAHGAMVHHTGAAVETAQWVAIFTQHISTIPYRRQRDAANESAAFCMESGQVRTGDSPGDTYVRMLQEIVRVTAPIAHGIAGEFPTVAGLVRGLEDGGPLVLEGIRKSANRDGAFTDRTIGQAVSRRIHKVFLGRDEASTDI